MVSITDNLTYVDLTKLSSFNQTLNISTNFTFDSIQQTMSLTFATYPILQWMLSIIIFVSIFMILKELLQADFYSDSQLLILTSFVLIAFNIILLFYNIFTITTPLQFFFLVWLVTIISIEIKK